jgi:hypothetical protein
MRCRLDRTPWMALAVLALQPLPGWTQNTPAGGEFKVSSYTSNHQYARANAISMGSDGRFVIAWESPQDGSSYAAMARRYENTGAALANEFVVNTYTTGPQYAASVAVSPRGRFLISWQSNLQDGSLLGTYVQRFDRNGVRTGSEFRANSYTTETQSRPSVAFDTPGNAVVVWRSAGVNGQDGDTSGVYAQRYDQNGFLQGAEFRVNSYTTSYQNRPDVARAPGGDFVVAWQSLDQEGYAFGYGIYAQRYRGTDGAPVGAEFRVNSYTTSDQAYPSVAIDQSGNFVVVWLDYSTRDGSLSSIRGQRFNAAGAAQGGEFQVNNTTNGYQYLPVVGMATDVGGFVVSWTHNQQTPSTDRSVRARRFDASGASMGDDFQVNDTDPSYQYNGSVGVDPVGNFAVAWNSDDQDSSGSGVYAQRYGGLFPETLAVDPNNLSTSDGNGVWEMGETVDMNAGWRNRNGANQSFSGLLVNLTGPSGPTYTITDGSTNYGNVGNNALGACTTNCFRVQVAGTRPSGHVDASVVETITPLAMGQQKRWALHIGESFTDVPRGGFYRFVETLLHHSITGGCAPNSYCPTNPTTREQMSVFALVAKEGAGYQPPACVPPNTFNDVPETNPFCRFIEELAARGVVGGCGNNNYCPATAVTRDQMAVFVLRTLDPALDPPACGTPRFADVPASSPFCKWIEELARRNIVTGCGGPNYCPTSPVTREQMGVFIGLTFGLNLYGP